MAIKLWKAERFASSQLKLSSPQILALQGKEERYALDTDARDCCIGCALLQKQESDINKQIGYWAKILNGRKRNLDNNHRKWLTVTWAISLLDPYPESTRFLVLMDHHSLRWVLNLVNITGQLTRWRPPVTEYDFIISFWACVEH